MDVYESLENNKRNEKLSEYNKFRELAYKTASQGFDEDSITDILRCDDCSKDTAKKLAFNAFNDLPEEYATETEPPASFFDVKDIVEKSILTASKEKFAEYFNKYHKSGFQDIINRILIARDHLQSSLVSEVSEEIRPLVDDLIITNKVLAKEKIASVMDDKEILEKELFGIWSPSLIQKISEMRAGDEKILNKIEKDKTLPGDNISFI